MIAHCEDMQDRFAILDPPPACARRRQHPGAPRGARVRPGFAALYYPWIVVPDPLAGASGQTATILVPPSGHIAGIYARPTTTRGVHKAPANEVVRGVLGLERTLLGRRAAARSTRTASTSSAVLPGRGHPGVGRAHDRDRRRSGATSTSAGCSSSSRSRSRRAPSSRLRAEQPGAVAEGQAHGHRVPDRGLARRRARSATRRKQAFYVEVRRRAEPAEHRALGQLIIEIGVAPTTPAEFVIFRIIQHPGRRSSTSEARRTEEERAMATGAAGRSVPQLQLPGRDRRHRPGRLLGVHAASTRPSRSIEYREGGDSVDRAQAARARPSTPTSRSSGA